ncbi:hypothetical protein BDW62DRAFT_202851 [Aspergillus aurantiobrunneus]
MADLEVDQHKIDELSSGFHVPPPRTTDKRDYNFTGTCARESEPHVGEIAQLLANTGIKSENDSPPASVRPADSEDKSDSSDMPGKPSARTDKQQRGDDQDDIVRVCFNLQSGCEMDVDVRVKGDFAVSLL